MSSTKRAAASAALVECREGMLIGLGTGSTAREFVSLLGGLVADGFECVCVPTSNATADQARGLGIAIVDEPGASMIDVTIDGADEVDPDLNLIKGAGGALLREKIVAAASRRMVVIADQTKMVPVLGAFPLPIEVNRFGIEATRARIADIVSRNGGSDALRLREQGRGQPFMTDGGHLIFDAFFGRISNAKALSEELLNIPGVVQHGLFLDMCDAAYVAGDSGVVFYGGARND